jgi:PII-like signaling protein
MEVQKTSNRRRGKSRQSLHKLETTSNSGGSFGLLGLELSALRKSFDGKTKYNFDDFLNNSIPEQYTIDVINDKDEMIKLTDPSNENQLKSYLNSDNRNSTFDELYESVNGKFEINLIDHEKIKGPAKVFNAAGIDPLDDILYEKIHEKLARRERKFMLIDRDRMLNEVDNCTELLHLLGIELKKKSLKETLTNYIVEDIELSDEQIFRLSHLLGTVTSINDPTDALEMILKYRLTIREIRMFLLNFLKIKTLEIMMKKEVLRIYSSNLANHFAEPTTEADVNELRNRRLDDRTKRMGKIVKVKFKEGVELQIDPIRKPRVVVNAHKK